MPAAASAIPVKPRTAAISATTKKIRAQRNIIESSGSSRSGTNALSSIPRRNENSTAGILGTQLTQSHTADHLLFREVTRIVGKHNKTQRFGPFSAALVRYCLVAYIARPSEYAKTKRRYDGLISRLRCKKFLEQRVEDRRTRTDWKS
jgi:hypothetical protein